MKYPYLLICVGVIDLFLLGNLSAQDNFNVTGWTPIVTDSNIVFDHLSLSKRRWMLNVRCSPVKDMTKIQVSKMVFNKKTGKEEDVRYVVRYDANYAGLYLKAVVKRMGLKTLPKDSSEVVIKTMMDGFGNKNHWLFIEGANSLLWLSTAIKYKRSNEEPKSNGNIVKCEARVYRLNELLRIKGFKLDSVDGSLVFSQGEQIFVLSALGEALDISSISKNITACKQDSVMGMQMMSVMTEIDTSWVAFTDYGPIVCGSFLGNLSNKDSTLFNDSDSLGGKAYFDGQSLKVLWLDGHLSDYDLGLDEKFAHQVDFASDVYGQAKVIKVRDYGYPQSVIWLRDEIVTPPPDSLYFGKLSDYILYSAKQEGVLGLVNTTGSFRLLNIEGYGKTKNIRTTSLQNQSSINSSNSYVEPYFTVNEDLAIVEYEKDNGETDSLFVWPDREILTPYYGQPVYGSDSLYLFKTETELLQPLPDFSDVKLKYYLPSLIDKKIYSFVLKNIGGQSVIELSYKDGWQTRHDWLWLPSRKITPFCGKFIGRAEYDSSIYVFLDWGQLTLLSTAKWWHKSYHFDFSMVCPVASLDDYSAVVYSQINYQGDTNVLARVVCAKKDENKKWLYDRISILKNIKPGD